MNRCNALQVNERHRLTLADQLLTFPKVLALKRQGWLEKRQLDDAMRRMMRRMLPLFLVHVLALFLVLFPDLAPAPCWMSDGDGGDDGGPLFVVFEASVPWSPRGSRVA